MAERGRPARIVRIGKPKEFKKAYTVTICERGVEDNKITCHNKTNTTFQIRDIDGKSTLQSVKERLIKALEGS